MGQRSRPMPNDICANPFYLDSGPYSADGRGWEEKCYIENTGDPDTSLQRTRLRGVIPTAWDKLVVTTSGAQAIAVASGAAWCHGTEFIFDETETPVPPLNFTVAVATATRQDRVVVVQNNSGSVYLLNLAFPNTLTDYNGLASIPAYCTRIAILLGNDGVGPRNLVQNSSVWMVELASYTIDNVGAITAFTDRREFAQIEKIVGIVAADNNTDVDGLVIGAEVDDTGVGGAGMGVAVRAKLDDSAGNLQDAGRMVFAWKTPTSGAEVSSWKLYTQYIANQVVSGVIVAPSVASPDGNARGAGAVDLQGYRAAATEVASGDYSVICGGRENTASATEAFCGGGEDNEATGANSVVCGGNANIASGQTSTVVGGSGNQATNLNCTVGGGSNNQATGANNATVCGGTTNTATGNTDTVCGGDQNDATGGLGFIGGGSLHACNAQSATISGGFTNTASGSGAAVAGGRFNTASALDSGIPGGSRCLASLQGQIASASGRFAADGDAQGTIQMANRASIAHPGGASWQNLYLDGSALLMTIASDTAWTVEVKIVGTTQGGGAGMDIANYRIEAAVENDNGVASVKSQSVTEIHDDTGTCDAQLAISGTSLVVQVEDTNAVTRRWVATVSTAECSYP